MSNAVIEDKPKRPTKFDGPGLNFKAKLIGLEDVPDPRGDKMCQVAMAKLKAAVLAIGEHKQRIVVNVSLDGIKIQDEKSAEIVLHHHPVHRISFISRDTNDSRAFGYVYNREDGAHQFIGIKTEKAAEPLVASLRDLFLTVVEMKKEKERELSKNETNIKVYGAEVKEVKEVKEDSPKEKVKEEEIPEEKAAPPSTDLLGLDSGLEQGMAQMNAFGSGGSTNVWLDNSLFQNPSGTSVVASGQTGAKLTTQPGLMSTGTSPFLPQGSIQMAGMGVGVAAMQPNHQHHPHQQQTYPQTMAGMQSAGFGMSPPASFPVQVGGHPAPQWSQPQAPAAAAAAAGGLVGSGMNSNPVNPSWMSFDSSISSIFGDVSAPPTTTTSGSAGSSLSFSSVPIQPTSASSDPFASTTKFPDPFADLAILTTQPHQPLGKKMGKDDFIKEPPKPSLHDLQASASAASAAASEAADPFSAVVSPPRHHPLYNPFAVGQTTPTNPFATTPNTLDKSLASPSPSLHPSAAQHDLEGGSDPDDLGSGSMSRPRPKGHVASRPGMLIPIPSKNNSDPFGISSA